VNPILAQRPVAEHGRIDLDRAVAGDAAQLVISRDSDERQDVDFRFDLGLGERHADADRIEILAPQAQVLEAELLVFALLGLRDVADGNLDQRRGEMLGVVDAAVGDLAGVVPGDRVALRHI
jgi:hypothetical protein